MKKILQKIVSNNLVRASYLYFTSSEIGFSSIAVAYYLLLMTFPLLLVAANIVPYLNIDTTQILQYLADTIPKQLYPSVANVVEGIFNRPSSSLLTIAIVTTIWTFLLAMSSLQRAMNKAYNLKVHRDFLIANFIGLVAGVIIFIFLIMTIFVSIFGRLSLIALHHHFNFDSHLYHTLLSMTQPVTALGAFLLLIVLYYLLPNVRIKKLRYVLPGAIFTTTIVFLLTNLIGLYISNAMNRLTDFRVIGSIVVFAMMLWYIVLARILIFGAILNAIYMDRHVDCFETRRGDTFSLIQSRHKTKDSNLD